MTRWLAVCVCLLAAVPVSAQPPAVVPGEIRCPDCAASGQKPVPPGFDASQIEFVPAVIPAFMNGQTLRMRIVARVLHAAPLVLEMLDLSTQMVDRAAKVVRDDRGSGPDSGTCTGPSRIQAVDLASKPVVSALRLNDIVTGTVMLHQNPKKPDSPLDGTFVLTGVRKASAPATLIHTAPVADSCANRSGRLVVYAGAAGELTEVYNDGALHHRNAAYLEFRRERLSPAELGDLLAAFRAVDFDALPSTFPARETVEPSTLALIGARYQPVKTTGNEARLAPLIDRLDALAERAMSHARYILKGEKPIPLVNVPWPYPEIALDRFVNPRLRSASDAPAAWRQRVPDEFLAALPAQNASDLAGNDPNRLAYFSQSGKMYRVVKPLYCKPGASCTFVNLDAAEVAEPAKGECVFGTPNCQTTIYPGGREMHLAADPYLTASSGRLWPPAMAARLRDLAPDGTVISREEYEKHKSIYFPMLRYRTLGANFIEGGLLYPHVRLCQIDAGSSDSCELKLPDGVR